MMNIKIVVSLIISSILGFGPIVHAQQAKKVFRVGVLSPRLRIEIRDETFRKGLRDLGYIEGQNIIIEWRFAE